MSAQTKPRAADVARWVATLAAPEVSLYSVEMRRQDRAAKAKAKGMLASWGLDAQGNPKPAPVVDNRAEQEWGPRGVFRCGGAS